MAVRRPTFGNLKVFCSYDYTRHCTRPGAPSSLDTHEILIWEVQRGLLRRPRSLPPWMFYDVRGSRIFERITELPEYYPTRTERNILASCCDAIIAAAFSDKSDAVRLVELGAGTASKTAILLDAAARLQSEVLYAPVDVSSDALDVACETIATLLPEVCSIADCSELCDTSSPARILQRNNVGIIHRFKHGQLHTRRGANDSSQSQGPTANQ